MKRTSCFKGQWVEISWVALEVGSRAPGIPEATERVPLQCRVKGFALDEATLGNQVSVGTMSGRVLEGVLISIEPSHTHSFGNPQPELLQIGPSLRREVE